MSAGMHRQLSIEAIAITTELSGNTRVFFLRRSARVRGLSISRSLNIAQAMQMQRAAPLEFSSAVDLALAPTCLTLPQSRADVSQISEPKAKPANIDAGARQRWQRSRRPVNRIGGFEDASRLREHRCLLDKSTFFLNTG